MMTTMEYHNPVLLQASVDGLNINPDGIYVDVTFGGGGHSREILSRLSPKGQLFAFDQDSDAAANVIDDSRFTLIPQNFRHIKRFLRLYQIKTVDGILGDFGVSSHQFDVAERGFSTRFEAELDMRMDQKGKVSAKTVINYYDEDELKRVFFDYGELKNAPALARTIIDARANGFISDSSQLQDVLSKHIPEHFSNKVLAQIYQAIRIEVNDEISVIRDFLPQALDILKVGGRLSMISYHSLEDRLVKRYFKNGMFEGEPERDMFGNFSVPLKSIGKLIVPDANEIHENSRARSAKLRIAEKL